MKPDPSQRDGSERESRVEVLQADLTGVNARIGQDRGHGRDPRGNPRHPLDVQADRNRPSDVTAVSWNTGAKSHANAAWLSDAVSSQRVALSRSMNWRGVWMSRSGAGAASTALSPVMRVWTDSRRASAIR